MERPLSLIGNQNNVHVLIAIYIGKLSISVKIGRVERNRIRFAIKTTSLQALYQRLVVSMNIAKYQCSHLLEFRFENLKISQLVACWWFMVARFYNLKIRQFKRVTSRLRSK